jgi:hypothetical protein
VFRCSWARRSATRAERAGTPILERDVLPEKKGVPEKNLEHVWNIFRTPSYKLEKLLNRGWNTWNT